MAAAVADQCLRKPPVVDVDVILAEAINQRGKVQPRTVAVQGGLGNVHRQRHPTRPFAGRHRPGRSDAAGGQRTTHNFNSRGLQAACLALDTQSNDVPRGDTRSPAAVQLGALEGAMIEFEEAFEAEHGRRPPTR